MISTFWRTSILTGATLAVVALATMTMSARASGAPRRSVVAQRSSHDITVGTEVRSWLQVTPAGAAGRTAPILVVLHGSGATPEFELHRDGFTDLANSGAVELVYPAGVGASWNAGGCCGKAAREEVDDVAFIEQLVASVDPGRTRPIYLVGYSNGGRMTYRIACTEPTLFLGYAIVNAMPEPSCVVDQPVTLLQSDGTKDPEVPYQPGDPGKESPAATTEVARLEVVDHCSATPTVQSEGRLVLRKWSDCADRARLAFASYVGLAHQWPKPTAATPGEASVIWSFFQQAAT